MGVYQLHTSQFKNKSSWKWTHRRLNLFILELDPVIAAERVMEGKFVGARQANPRHKIVKWIHWASTGNYIGATCRCQYAKAWVQRELEAKRLIDEGHTII